MAMNRTHITGFRLVTVVAVIVSMHLATTSVHYPIISDIYDKLQHMLAFYVLALLCDFSFPASGFSYRKALVVLGYGLLIEFIQYFLPYRSCSLFDLGADGVGIVAYWLSLPALQYVPVLRQRWNSTTPGND